MNKSYNLTEVNHLYNIKDRVFIYESGKIIHCIVTTLYVRIDEEGIHVLYGVKGDSEFVNRILHSSYEEDRLSSSLEEIINHIEVL